MDWYVAPDVHNILRDVLASSNCMDGIALITTDGVLLAWAFNRYDDPDRPIVYKLTTTIASIVALGGDLVQDIGKGTLRSFQITLVSGSLVILPVHGYLLLVALSRERVSFGLIYINLVSVRNRLSAIPGEGIIIPRPPDSLDSHATPPDD